jgi:murein L,D-transpeptidase YcbB/YkuD
MIALQNAVRTGISAKRLIRALALTAAAMSVAGCAGLGGTHAPATKIVTSDAALTQTALRDVLQPGPGAPTQPDRILRFYRARDFRPAWTGNPEAVKAAAEIEAVLARAHEQGLRDADYRVPPAVPMPGNDAAAFEIRLTDAVLRYARDVRVGRIGRNAVYDDVGLPAAKFDPAASLAEARNADTLSAFLAGLPPPDPEYGLLVAALAHYRAIAAKGGWPTLDGRAPIRPGGKDKRLNTLIVRLAYEDAEFAAIAKPTASDLTEAIKRFQMRHGIDAAGFVGPETLAALNVPAKTRAEEIAANMERRRWLPRILESRYVAVNVPDQSVDFVRDGKSVLHSKVIIGRKETPTPITRATIEAVVVNPPWDIPGDIAARALLPRLKRDPNYLAARHMVVMDGPPHDPYGRTIAWKKIVPADFPYAIRQLPGPDTALGALMLDSPNDFDVYLHDTPNKARFAEDDREISNGCVRVQQIFPLASLALTGDPDDGIGTLRKEVKTGKTERVALADPLPVYFLYWTAIANKDGSVDFPPDLYDRDQPLINALDGDANAAPVKLHRPKPLMTDEDEDSDEDVSP